MGVKLSKLVLLHTASVGRAWSLTVRHIIIDFFGLTVAQNKEERKCEAFIIQLLNPWKFAVHDSRGLEWLVGSRNVGWCESQVWSCCNAGQSDVEKPIWIYLFIIIWKSWDSANFWDWRPRVLVLITSSCLCIQLKLGLHEEHFMDSYDLTDIVLILYELKF